MQALWGSPLHHVQLDAFRDMEPPGYWSGWESMEKDKTDLMMGALCRAMHSAVREYSRHGQEVVLDTALTNPQARRMLIEDFSELPAYLVAVHCDKAELGVREAQRGNRPAGLGASQFDWIHRRLQYDFEINTASRGAEQCAADLLRWWRSNPEPSALRQLRANSHAADHSFNLY